MVLGVPLLCFFQSALITEKTLSSFDLDVRTKAFSRVICSVRSILQPVTMYTALTSLIKWFPIMWL